MSRNYKGHHRGSNVSLNEPDPIIGSNEEKRLSEENSRIFARMLKIVLTEKKKQNTAINNELERHGFKIWWINKVKTGVIIPTEGEVFRLAIILQVPVRKLLPSLESRE